MTEILFARRDEVFTGLALEEPVANNELLAFNSATGKWVNRTAAELGLLAAGHTHTSADITDFSEAAQDAVGSILSDVGDIDFTYDDVTPAITASVKADSVTFAKFQNISTDRLLGRDTAGTGDVEEIALGGGLEFTGSGSIQRSALTGDVTVSAGSNTTTIVNNAVTDAKLRDSAATSVIGRSAGTSGDPADIAASADGQVLRRASGALGFGTIATAGIGDDQVTLAKLANISTDRLLGRDTAGTGDPEEITVGGGLEFTGAGGIQRSALTGDVTASAGSNATTVIAASTTQAGKVELATTTETLTGTDTALAVTPDALAALWEKGSNVASAATITLGEGNLFHITGTTAITDIDFATPKDGRGAWLIFDGALTLTHNATTLVIPGGANITTAAGDRAYVMQDASDNVYVMAYVKADGTAIVGGGGGGGVTDGDKGDVVVSGAGATWLLDDRRNYVSVRAATVSNITISTALNNGDVLDGVTLATGDLVLVKNQTSAAENGIYEVGPSPARAAGFTTYDVHAGLLVSVQEGSSSNRDTLWLSTTNKGGTLGSSSITFGGVPTLFNNQTWSGTQTMIAGLTTASMLGEIQLERTSASFSTGQNDLNLGGTVVWRLSASTPINITGVSAGNLTTKILLNTGSNTITLKHENTSSLSFNRFALPGGADLALAPGYGVLLWYDNDSSRWRAVDVPSGDGDKGDITVSSSGTVWTIDNDAVTYAKIQNVSATDKLLGRASAGAGDIEEITCTAFARSLLDDADANVARTTLGAQIKLTGAVLWWPGNTPPAWALVLDGSAISRTTYADLWAFAQNSGNLAASEGAKTDGQFGPGDGSTTFSLPNLMTSRRFIRAKGSGSIGAVEADAAPNITGTAVTFTRSGISGGGGAFSASNSGTNAAAAGSSQQGTLSFNASNSNAKYGAASEIRPVNVAFLPIIVF